MCVVFVVCFEQYMLPHWLLMYVLPTPYSSSQWLIYGSPLHVLYSTAVTTDIHLIIITDGYFFLNYFYVISQYT